jgi:tautomerase-like protein
LLLEIRERKDQMPLLRFNILEGRTDAEIEKLLDAAHAAVVAAFPMPDGDRYQLVSEYRPGRMIALDMGLGIA